MNLHCHKYLIVLFIKKILPMLWIRFILMWKRTYSLALVNYILQHLACHRWLHRLGWTRPVATTVVFFWRNAFFSLNSHILHVLLITDTPMHFLVFSPIRDACPEKIEKYWLKIFWLPLFYSKTHALTKMAYFIWEKNYMHYFI